MITEVKKESPSNGIKEEKNIITIGVPQDVIEDIEIATIGKTQLFRSKALFLVWLINRGDKLIGQKDFNNKYYQLHTNEHRKLFGSDDLEKLKKLLIANNIIKQTGNASAEAGKCNTYQAVKWWKFKGKNTELIHLPTSYAFLQKFKEMNFWVLPKREQKIVKESLNNIENNLIQQVEVEKHEVDDDKPFFEVEEVVIDIPEDVKVIQMITAVNVTEENEIKYTPTNTPAIDEYITLQKNMGAIESVAIEKALRKFILPVQPESYKEQTKVNIQFAVDRIFKKKLVNEN
ncbi:MULTISPECIES: hypothetical protein [Sphingobacterium]|uniref:hypothetical protein n=1 Tax=Sphingobacterium TaxID=28453 RepID=UPI0013DAE187|nr:MULTISPECIES: hypothetical protein [unclassified Sphingobacterium]